MEEIIFTKKDNKYYSIITDMLDKIAYDKYNIKHYMRLSKIKSRRYKNMYILEAKPEEDILFPMGRIDIDSNDKVKAIAIDTYTYKRLGKEFYNIEELEELGPNLRKDYINSKVIIESIDKETEEWL